MFHVSIFVSVNGLRVETRNGVVASQSESFSVELPKVKCAKNKFNVGEDREKNAWSRSHNAGYLISRTRQTLLSFDVCRREKVSCLRL